jgi:hypothetical protein
MLVSASLTGPQLAEGLRLRYRQAREAMQPVFRAALGKVRGEDPEDIGDELLAMIDGITVSALSDPERCPPGRQWHCCGEHWQGWAIRQELLRASLARDPF